MKIKTFLATLALGLLATIASASTPNVQGRWEFVTLTGDTPTQLNQAGQSTLSTYLLQSGSTITNIEANTTDTYMDDVNSYNNDVITGTAHSTGVVNLTLVITNSPSSKVTINFTGTVSNYTQHGANATVMTGTYTSNGQYTTGGNFVATYFPDFTGATYSGTLDGPDTGSGPTQVSASFSIQTKSDHTLSIGNFTLGEPLAACFVPPFHVINDPNYPLSQTSATGVNFQVYLQDSVGGQIWMNAYSILSDGVTPAALDYESAPGVSYPTSNLGAVGTNNTYEVFYGITTNNSCNGLGGGDAPFQAQVPKHKREEKRLHHTRR